MTGRALSANAIRIARGRAATRSLPTALPLARNYATTPAQQQQQQQQPSSPQRNTVSSQAQPDPSLAPLRVLHPPSHLASYFWPTPLRRHYLTLQSLFLELAHVPSTVSSEILGRIRYGWWRDAIAACYRGEGRRYKHPIIVALEELIWDPEVRRRGGVVQEHFEAIVDAWENALSSSPTAPTLQALEAASERIYSRQLYLQLNLAGVDDRNLDEIFSHMGKANGLVEAIIDTPMRLGVKLTPSKGTGADGNVVGRVAKNRKPPMSETARGLILPSEYLEKHGVVEEEVKRQGGMAKGFKDAVFETATRANDYLITVRRDIREKLAGGKVSNEGGRAVLVGTATIPHLLERLERYDFDPFEPQFRIEARGHGWRLPLKMYRVGWTGKV